MLIPFPSSATLTRFDVCDQDGVLPGMFCMCLCVLCVLCVCVRACLLYGVGTWGPLFVCSVVKAARALAYSRQGCARQREYATSTCTPRSMPQHLYAHCLSLPWP